MKKILCFTLCFCFLLFAACNSNKTNNETTTTKTGKLSDKIEFKIYDDSSKIWLNNSHIKEIILTSKNDEKSLIIKTTEEGKKLLQKATEENKGKVISISANKYLLSSTLYSAPIKNGEILMTSQPVDYSYVFNYLTDAKDKMAGVTPPKTLISEEDAKKIIFDYVGFSADKIPDVKSELKITEKYFGWEYCIDFSYNDLKYTAEVNAHTGGIIKFLTDFT